MLQYKWVALSNTTIGVMMASIDSNIVLIALPTIGREFTESSLLTLVWVLLGYQLIIAVVLVNFGRLGDMFGRVRLYILGFALFTLGSGLCSISQSGAQLVAFRTIQAAGAAFLIANSAAILTDAFPPNERGRALGANQVSIVAGSLIGLILGGVLTSTVGWRSIFWVNLPIGVFGTAWARYKLREVGNIRSGQRLDIFGNLSFAGGLALLLAGPTLYVLGGLDLAIALLMFISGILLLSLFFFAETRVKEPMLDLSLFRIRLFSAGNASILLNGLSRGCVTLVLTFYLQGPSMGLDPLAAGIFLIPASASLAFWGPISGWLSDRSDARILASLGLAISAAGFLLLATIGKTVSFAQLAPSLVLVGSGFGIYSAPNRASIMNSVPPRSRGIASGTSSTIAYTGGTLSLAIAFLIMATVTPVADLQQIFLGSRVSQDASWIGSFISSIHLVYYISAALVLAAIIPSLMRGQSTRSKEEEE